jgi:hypothetical protein
MLLFFGDSIHLKWINTIPYGLEGDHAELRKDEHTTNVYSTIKKTAIITKKCNVLAF